MRWIFLLFVSFSPLFAKPSQVILVRHAEKSASNQHLSLRGRQRAAALCPYFLGSPTTLQFGTPTAIYAMKVNRDPAALSCQQSMLCLAEELDLPLQNSYGAGDEDSMVTEIIENEEYEGKMVLICWSNRELPHIASLLGATRAPKKWPDNVYDRLWIINLSEGVTTENTPQKLLYGDSNR